MWNGDSPQTFDDLGKPYEVFNYGNNGWGQVDLMTATKHSINTIFVPLGINVGPDKVVDVARRAGIPDTVAMMPTPSFVLGTSSPHVIDVANAYAAEHLEIQTVNSKQVSKQIRNAGAVFIGRFTPVSLGDYSAGSNHVLPTGGCACHSSGLSVQTFLKGVSFIEYDESAFTEIAPNVITLANSEDLPAHGEAMNARFEGKK